MAESKTKMMVRLPYSMLERIKEKAWRHEKSMNGLVVQLLDDMLAGRLCLWTPAGERVAISGVSSDPSEWDRERLAFRTRGGYQHDLFGESDDSTCNGRLELVETGQQK